MIESKDSKKWIVLYTKPKHEKTIARELKKMNFEVYLPLLRERRKWSDRKKWVEFPLFKSYIFVRIELKNILRIIKIPGIVKIIKFGKNFAIIRQKDIDAIRILLDGGYNPIPTEYFIKGDPVIIKNGPLKGISGEVTRVDESDLLIIRIDAIQQSISVKIDRAYLSKTL